MICGLCRHEFNESEGRNACSGCGTRKSCSGVRCPKCYYEMVSTPKWMSHLANFFNVSSLRNATSQGLDFPAANGIPLSQFEIHQPAEIVDLRTHDHLILRKMIAMDVLPGTRITLMQKFPSLVFQINQSSFSIDRELASVICVKSI